ncbi:MAG: F0F1 ATP synthase subunit B [Candidatus Pelagibacter sp. TMED118]|nr:MAG: F0F1 ATP synthase subunit B [Candidatus Pelagibacter sp. TMED118]|tara:strand:- start:3886 stop:4470 length:585 start_codon:yes stop_codon:yes gene_type:complete
MLKKIIFLYLYFFLASSVQAAEKGGMPQLNPEFWISQIFWLVITFGILFFILSKFVLPNISENLENRKSQILSNIEEAENQRNNSEKKLKEYDEIVVSSRNQAKIVINEAKAKILNDINLKKEALDKEISSEINLVETEIQDLKRKSPEKINQIAVDTASDLLKQLIGADVNKSNISAIVEDLSKKRKGKYYEI